MKAFPEFIIALGDRFFPHLIAPHRYEVALELVRLRQC